MLCQRTSRRKTATKKVRITTARPRLELLEDRCLLSATPLTFAPVNPLGSLVYEGSVSNAFISPGTTDSYTFTINAGQTLAAVVTPQSAGLQPSFQILNSSNQVVGGGTASAAGSAALQQVISAAGGAYTVNVAGASNTTGMYTIQVYLNAAIDSGDNGGASNNTLATAQDLTDSLETLSNGIGSATRADVVGSVGNGAVIINAADAGSYDETGFHDSASKQYISGLLSTPPSFTTYNDYFVFDLSGVAAGTVINGAELVLANQGSASPNSSDTWTVYDVSTPIAALEASNSGRTDIFNDLGSGAAYGIETFNFNNNPQAVVTTLNAAGVAALNGAIGGQIAMGGAVTTAVAESSDYLYEAGGLGVGSQELLLTTSEVEFYKFSAAAGDNVTVGLTQLTGLSGSSATIQLLNSSGTVLASGVAGSTNLSQAISNYAIGAAGAYYIEVVGGNTNCTFNLVLTDNASFDTQPNGSVAQAQDITNSHAVLGAIGVSGAAYNYKVTLAAGQTALEFETTTPNPFNNSLVPQLAGLLDSSGNEVPSAQVILLPDGRNEELIATGLTPGATYVLQLGAHNTTGEFFLTEKALTSLTSSSLPIQVDDNQANNNKTDALGTFTLSGASPPKPFGWTTVSAAAAFHGSESVHAGSATDTADATWSYTVYNDTGGAAPYALDASWAAAATNATNATYKIYVDQVKNGPAATATVDQTQSPDTAVFGTTAIQLLAYIPVPAGPHTIIVVLSDVANGNVVADGIFDPPETDAATSGLTAMAPAQPATGPAGVSVTSSAPLSVGATPFNSLLLDASDGTLIGRFDAPADPSATAGLPSTGQADDAAASDAVFASGARTADLDALDRLFSNAAGDAGSTDLTAPLGQPWTDGAAAESI